MLRKHNERALVLNAEQLDMLSDWVGFALGQAPHVLEDPNRTALKDLDYKVQVARRSLVRS